MLAADIPGADAALVLGGILTMWGSICAIVALLDRHENDALDSIAVCSFGLGAVLRSGPLLTNAATGSADRPVPSDILLN